jgi:flagellin-like protein
MVERGISPVVGAAILIGIVVVLASVIGAFVLSFGPGDETAPSTSLGFDTQREQTFVDNQSTRWTDVLAVQILHENGDQVDRNRLRVQVKPDIGGAVTGYALGLRDGDNVTDPRWNLVRGDGSRIEAGDSSRYALYMTEQIGTAGDFDADTVANAWETDRCTVEHFGVPRETSDTPIGVLNISSSGAATDRCPAPVKGYNVTASTVDQAGRIRAGDQIDVIWQSPQGSTSILSEYEVKGRS